MKTKTIKINRGTIQKSGTVLVALGTILKAGVEIAKVVSKK